MKNRWNSTLKRKLLVGNGLDRSKVRSGSDTTYEGFSDGVPLAELCGNLSMVSQLMGVVSKQLLSGSAVAQVSITLLLLTALRVCSMNALRHGHAAQSLAKAKPIVLFWARRSC